MDRDDFVQIVRLGLQWLSAIAIGYGVGTQEGWAALAGAAALLAGYWWSRRYARGLRAQATSSAAALGMLKQHIAPRA